MIADWTELAHQGYHHSIDGGLYRCFDEDGRSTWVGECDVRNQETSNHSQPYPMMEGGLRLDDIRTTYPLALEIAEPPPNHVRMLISSGLSLDSVNWAVCLMNDARGNARWTTATAYINADPLPTLHPGYLAMMNARRYATFMRNMPCTKQPNTSAELYPSRVESSSSLPQPILAAPKTGDRWPVFPRYRPASTTGQGATPETRNSSIQRNVITGAEHSAGEEAKVNAILDSFGHRFVQYVNSRGEQVEIPFDLYLRVCPEERAKSISQVKELEKKLMLVPTTKSVKPSTDKHTHSCQQSIPGYRSWDALWWQDRVQRGVVLPSNGSTLKEIYDTFGRLVGNEIGRSAFSIALRMHFFATTGRTAWSCLPCEEQLAELTDAVGECQKAGCPETARVYILAAVKQVSEFKSIHIELSDADEDPSERAQEGTEQFLLDTTQLLWNRIAYSPASQDDPRRQEILGRVQYALGMWIQYAYKVISLCMAMTLWPSHTFRSTSAALRCVSELHEIQLRNDKVFFDQRMGRI